MARLSWGIGIAGGMIAGVASGSAFDSTLVGIAVGLAVGVGVMVTLLRRGGRGERPHDDAEITGADGTSDGDTPEDGSH